MRLIYHAHYGGFSHLPGRHERLRRARRHTAIVEAMISSLSRSAPLFLSQYHPLGSSTAHPLAARDRQNGRAGIYAAPSFKMARRLTTRRLRKVAGAMGAQTCRRCREPIAASQGQKFGSALLARACTPMGWPSSNRLPVPLLTPCHIEAAPPPYPGVIFRQLLRNSRWLALAHTSLPFKRSDAEASRAMPISRITLAGRTSLLHTDAHLRLIDIIN